MTDWYKQKNRLNAVAPRGLIVPGSYYRVERYDWLDTISIRAYGVDSKVSDIINANVLLQQRNIEPVTQYPYIHPGDILWIPEDKTFSVDTVDFSYPNEIAIRVNGEVFRNIEAITLTKNLDTIADSFAFTGAYDPEHEDAIFFEPPFKKCEIFIGGNLFLTGTTEKWNPSYTDTSTKITIEGRSISGVLIDCTSPIKTLTYKNQSLQSIITSEFQPFGLKAEFQTGADINIAEAKKDPTSKVFDFIKDIIKDNQLIMSSLPNGAVIFTRANLNTDTVFDFEQGLRPLLSLSASYDWVNRYSEYTATCQGPGNADDSYTTIDESIDFYRPILFSSDTKTKGELEDAANWEKTRALTTTEIQISVVGWRDANNNLWTENTLVSLFAPKVFIFNRSNFLIKNVVLQKDENGERAQLTLVLPEAFTGEFPRKLPWIR